MQSYEICLTSDRPNMFCLLLTFTHRLKFLSKLDNLNIGQVLFTRKWKCKREKITHMILILTMIIIHEPSSIEYTKKNYNEWPSPLNVSINEITCNFLLFSDSQVESKDNSYLYLCLLFFYSSMVEGRCSNATCQGRQFLYNTYSYLII